MGWGGTGAGGCLLVARVEVRAWQCRGSAGEGDFEVGGGDLGVGAGRPWGDAEMGGRRRSFSPRAPVGVRHSWRPLPPAPETRPALPFLKEPRAGSGLGGGGTSSVASVVVGGGRLGSDLYLCGSMHSLALATSVGRGSGAPRVGLSITHQEPMSFIGELLMAPEMWNPCLRRMGCLEHLGGWNLHVVAQAPSSGGHFSGIK